MSRTYGNIPLGMYFPIQKAKTKNLGEETNKTFHHERLIVPDFVVST